MSNSLDPEQVKHFVGPGLGPNCLERLSADNTRIYRKRYVKSHDPINPLLSFVPHVVHSVQGRIQDFWKGGS